MSEDVVLLVDDDESVRDMTCMLLEYAGYRVLLAGNAAEAMAMMTDHPEVGVVVTDVNLKEGPNGFEMARAMKAAGMRASVIIISGDPSWRETSQAADMHFLAKPYASATLTQAVADGCSRRERAIRAE
jgi:DNA-binding NtrC family response regulator